MTQTFFYYVLAAIAEIFGCLAFWKIFRLNQSLWWAAPGILSLFIFAYFLSKAESPFIGRSYAAYGGVYIVTSLIYAQFIEGERVNERDLLGAGLCLIGAILIFFGSKENSL